MKLARVLIFLGWTLLLGGVVALVPGCGSCYVGALSWEPPSPAMQVQVTAGQSERMTNVERTLRGEYWFTMDVRNSNGEHARCRLELLRADGSAFAADKGEGKSSASCSFYTTVVDTGPLDLLVTASGDAGGAATVYPQYETSWGYAYLIKWALLAMMVGCALAGIGHVRKRRFDGSLRP